MNNYNLGNMGDCAKEVNEWYASEARGAIERLGLELQNEEIPVFIDHLLGTLSGQIVIDFDKLVNNAYISYKEMAHE